MNRRFFSEQPIHSDSIRLTGSEGHHVSKVLRAAVGDMITLFDGAGDEFEGRITAISRGAVELAIVRRETVSREAGREFVLGVALPKGDRQRTLVEKCVELGVARLVPLRTTRGVAVPKESAWERLRRGVIEASKQCGRNVLMEIGTPQSLEEFVAVAPPTATRWLAHPRSAPPTLAQFQPGAEPDMPRTLTAQTIYAAVGPEGGFTEDEVNAAVAAGWTRTSLGNSLLRVETAALALAAYWLIDPAC